LVAAAIIFAVYSLGKMGFCSQEEKSRQAEAWRRSREL